ncbi:MAG: cyclic nucleotide-binding domain-containing protein [Elusimicrobiales bacterium]|nr:cyclic nucleotide-binding domain-containing protein [Elusimicrobiales bacterium]
MHLSKLAAFFRDTDHYEQRDFLTRLPLFQGLRKNDFTYLLQTLDERVYLKGETLFEEGDIGRALFIVAAGNVQLLRKNAEGRGEAIAEVRPGEIFGEMALLEEMPRTAGAVAAEKTKVYLFYKNKLEHLLYNHPRIGVVIIHYLARTLSARLRAVMEQSKNPQPPAK